MRASEGKKSFVVMLEVSSVGPRRLRMRRILRQTRAARASCVEMRGGKFPGGVAAAFSLARLAAEMWSMVGISGDVASKG